MRGLAVAIVAALLATAAATAAWIIYNPVASGSATSSFSTVAHVNMITFSQGVGGNAVTPCTAGTGATCTGGAAGLINVDVTNNDQTAAHNAIAPVVALTSNIAACISHLFVTGTSNLTETVAAGATNQDATITYVADAATPASCSAATVTATITGTAS